MFTLYLLSLLPRKVSQAIGSLVGRGNYWFKTRAYWVTDTNLRICFPGLTPEKRQQLILASLINTGQTLLETPAVWLGKKQRLQTWFSKVTGEDLLQRAIQRGNGVIVLLPHIGNWELFNVFFANYGKTTALYQPPRQKFLKEPMEKIRSHFGHEMVATNRQGIARLYKALGEAGVLTILPDQVPAKGHFVPFFGEPALTDHLVSRLIRKTNAAVICVSIIRQQDGRFSVQIESCDEDVYCADLGQSIAGINKSIEHCVRKNPAQYQWEYKRFRERPAGKEKLYRNGKPVLFH